MALAVEEIVQYMQNDDDVKEGDKKVMLIPKIRKRTTASADTAKQACNLLFPLSDPENVVERKYAYIRYSKIRSKLRQRYAAYEKATQIKNRPRRDEYRLVRNCGQDELFFQMIDNPPGSPVLRPRPMAVEVPPLEEFEQFFCYMKDRSLPEDHVRCKRGIFYSDGRIDLCKQVVGPSWIHNLIGSIKQNGDVQHFLLGNNVINTPGATAIADFIRACRPKIETWYLAGNEINSDGVEKICEALKDDVHAKALWLKRNPLMTQGVKHVADMLAVNKSIEILDLDNTGMMDDGCEYLFERLLENTTIRQLYMSSNNLTVRAARSIAKYFRLKSEAGTRGLHSLFIGMNPLKDDGVAALAEGLQEYDGLERLVIYSCRMTHVSLAKLLHSLQTHPLLYLDVGHYKATADMREIPNYFGVEGAQHLGGFIKTHKTLKILAAQICHIPLEGIKILRDAFEESNLIYVELQQYGVKRNDLFFEINNLRMDKVKRAFGGFENFMHKLRLVKHTPRVCDIDSLYRNKM